MGQPTPMPSAGGSSARAAGRPLWVLRSSDASWAPGALCRVPDLCVHRRIRGLAEGGQGVGPAQSRRGGAREDGQAGRLGRSPSRLEEMRWQTQKGEGAGRHGEVGTQMREQRDKGDRGEKTEKWGEPPWFLLR